MTTLPHAHLDYAPAPRNARRATYTRRTLLVLALLLAALAVAKWYAPARDHLRLLHYQSRCLKGLPAASPEAFNSNALPVVTQYATTDWDRFYALFSPPGGRLHPNVFTGELRHKDGRRRLVAVDVDNLAAVLANSPPPPSLATTVIEPAGLFKPAQLRGSGNWTSPFDTHHSTEDAPTPKVLRLFTGQPDPNDSTHFTIAYTYDDKPGTIDAWLRPDDTILFELRDPAR